MWVYLNKSLTLAEGAVVSIFDRGFMYGDGAFETMRAHRRRVFRLEDHLRRLQSSAQALRMRLPHSPDAIASNVQAVLDRNNLDDAVVRVCLSRGCAGRGPAFDNHAEPTYVVVAEPLAIGQNALRPGVTVAISSVRRVPSVSLPSHVKHSNYLNSVLARAEATETGADEALMLTVEGYLSECSSANFFVVSGSILFTPSTDCDILPGITRSVVMEAAKRESIEVREMRLPLTVLESAEEAFITNSVLGILPAKRVGDHDFHAVGAITSRLVETYEAIFERETST